MKSNDDIRSMLNSIRTKHDYTKGKELDENKIEEKDNFVSRARILMEEAEQAINNEEQNADNGISINRNNSQFGSVIQSQENAIRKTVGNVSFKENALKFYPKIEDVVMNGEVNGLSITFQFRYNDPSGDGCYIWADGLQLSDTNARTIEKIRDAFLNWKQSIIEDGDLLNNFQKYSENK